MAVVTNPSIDNKTRGIIMQIVEQIKSEGVFDRFRRECLEELDSKEPYRQLKQRVESHVATFLSKQFHSPSLPKNQLRNSLRTNISQSEVLSKGVDRLLEEVLSEKSGSFYTEIEGLVHGYLSSIGHYSKIEKEKHQKLEISKLEKEIDDFIKQETSKIIEANAGEKMRENGQSSTSEVSVSSETAVKPENVSNSVQNEEETGLLLEHDDSKAPEVSPEVENAFVPGNGTSIPEEEVDGQQVSLSQEETKFDGDQKSLSEEKKIVNGEEKFILDDKTEEEVGQDMSRCVEISDTETLPTDTKTEAVLTTEPELGEGRKGVLSNDDETTHVPKENEGDSAKETTVILPKDPEEASSNNENIDLPNDNTAVLPMETEATSPQDTETSFLAETKTGVSEGDKVALPKSEKAAAQEKSKPDLPKEDEQPSLKESETTTETAVAEVALSEDSKPVWPKDGRQVLATECITTTTEILTAPTDTTQDLPKQTNTTSPEETLEDSQQGLSDSKPTLVTKDTQDVLKKDSKQALPDANPILPTPVDTKPVPSKETKPVLSKDIKQRKDNKTRITKDVKHVSKQDSKPAFTPDTKSVVSKETEPLSKGAETDVKPILSKETKPDLLKVAGPVSEDIRTDISKDTKPSGLKKDVKQVMPKDIKPNLQKKSNQVPSKEIKAARNAKAMLSNETKPVLSKETKSVLPKETKSVLPKESKSVLPKESKSVLPKETKSVLPKETKAVLPKETKLVSQKDDTKIVQKATQAKPGIKPESKEKLRNTDPKRAVKLQSSTEDDTDDDSFFASTSASNPLKRKLDSIDDIELSDSDITVSSVHTSDLSSLEDSLSDIEYEDYKAMRLKAKQGKTEEQISAKQNTSAPTESGKEPTISSPADPDNDETDSDADMSDSDFGKRKSLDLENIRPVLSEGTTCPSEADSDVVPQRRSARVASKDIKIEDDDESQETMEEHDKSDEPTRRDVRRKRRGSIKETSHLQEDSDDQKITSDSTECDSVGRRQSKRSRRTIRPTKCYSPSENF